MKRLILVIALFCSGKASFAVNKEESLHYGPFGKIVIYHPVQKPTSVALFVSGDGGWKDGVVNMAQRLTEQGALVLGIDARNYRKALAKRKTDCYYPAADFEQLSLMIQKKYKFSNYTKPVLLGYSYGATLVYGILAQAPANTFKGAVALGFCPDIESKKPFCKGSGLTQHVLKPGVSFWLERTEHLTAPFIALNGFKDEACPYAATASYLKDMPMAQLIELPKVGHGFAVEADWLPAFTAAYQKIINTPSFAERKQGENKELRTQSIKLYGEDLPLTIIPAAKKK